MAGAGLGGAAGRRARIEIIPLIDIIFFLLATFVMVSLSMTKNQGVQVALPATATAAQLTPREEQERTVTLSVTEKGDLFFNKEKISPAQLPFRLQALKSSNRDAKVVINGDAGADFKTVVGVLDEVKKIGITKVGISTDRK